MKSRELILHILAILFLLIMAVAFVWIKNEQIKLGYEYSKHYARYLEYKELNGKLLLEWEYLTDYNQLEKIARKEFNLRKPAPKDILYYYKPTHSFKRYNPD